MKFFIRTGEDFASLINHLGNMRHPFTVSVIKGAKRSDEQNQTVHKWFGELAGQRGDVTADEVKSECNLEYGLPIMMEADAEWKAVFGHLFRGLDYQRKLKAIRVLDVPFTRRMTVQQLNRYMTAMQKDAAERGFVLTIPQEEK